MPVFQAKSAAVQVLEGNQAEVRFLTRENTSLSVILPEEALYVLAQRIIWAGNPPPLEG